VAEIMWRPSQQQIENAHLTRFKAKLEKTSGRKFDDFAALHSYSIQEPEHFWNAIWEYCGIIAQTKGERILVDGDKMPGARFFPDARLNFAENLLVKEGSDPALIFCGEDKVEKTYTWTQLRELVSRLAAAFKKLGLGVGDRVAAVMPNMPETIAAMLAVTSIGAVWSSCSPDFGEQGIVDRFGQIEPKILIACDGYHYNGKSFDIAEKLKGVTEQLTSLEKVVIVAYGGDLENAVTGIKKAVSLEELVEDEEPQTIAFEQLPFDHPLYILFSSGTTGVPKCIIHSVGGMLLQHKKEHQLHVNVNSGDRLFYFTTCTWMMWNWLVTGLASGATLMLYDGSPFYPGPNVLFDFADKYKMTVFGTSAKYIDAVNKSGLRPRNSHILSSVRTILSTGSTLTPESFEFVYTSIKSDVCLSSVSGGTDIAACFVCGNPTAPVYRGEIQAPALGMAVEIWDDNGQPLASDKGELVCTKPFPSMPIGFWGDEGNKKYHNSYFAKYDNIWWQGDYAQWTPNGGIIIHGRSDATLNPGGVRIGTAEIYAQVEKMPEFVDCLAIGQDWDNDTRVILFVVMQEGEVLDEALAKRLKTQIRTGASPRHVPAKIIAVEDIPRTKSGKITELAVRDIVHGRQVKNKEALANPQALELFKDLEALKS
jgi:acetoacetyl-CoA synthetase